MNEDSKDDLESRILILAPTAKDAETTFGILSKFDLRCKTCSSLLELCEDMNQGAGVALLTEEAISSSEIDCLYTALRNQPTWSDFPLLVLMRGGMNSPIAASAEALGNVTLLERPIRIPALASAVRASLRSRQRQYQIRHYIVEQQKSSAQLEEASHRKDEFLAMLAHELRNPLAAVSNAVQVARRTNSKDHITWSISIIEAQVKHLSRMIDDLLDVSRITRGKIQLRKEVIDLAATIQRAAEAVRPLIEQRNHALILELSPGPVWVDADPTRLEQIFVNLLTNAAKYTERGGRIVVALADGPAGAHVSVRDNGIGISSEMLPQIFDLFTQASRSIDRSEGGLGIGLTLVRRLVEMHSGEIRAHSGGMGKGSEFVVSLPRAQVPTALEEPRDSISRVSGTKKILVVDDNVDTARGMAELLSLIGHDVRLAFDGPTALNMAAEFRPHVVLLDIGLPGMDGYEVARAYRSIESGDHAKIIAVSGYGQEEDRKRSREAGFDFHLVKPVEHDALLELF
ncbi:MAG: ATP-binding protein [Bdellovibrionota bacterium]